MTREIKFRAWDNLKKEMFYSDFHIGCYGKIYWWSGDGYNQVVIDGIELMQFTGLKDKNGKEKSVEIYDGDLMRSLPNGMEPREIWEVCWINTGWWLKIKSKMSGKDIVIPMDTSLEVIGNIYENPELL